MRWTAANTAVPVYRWEPGLLGDRHLGQTKERAGRRGHEAFNVLLLGRVVVGGRKPDPGGNLGEVLFELGEDFLALGRIGFGAALLHQAVERVVDIVGD